MKNEELRILEPEAKRMAISVNGGNWDKDYTDSQRLGWCLKIEWAIKEYCSKDNNNNFNFDISQDDEFGNGGRGYHLFVVGGEGHSPVEIQAVYDQQILTEGNSADDAAAWRLSVHQAMNCDLFAYMCVRSATDLSREPRQVLEKTLILQHYDKIGPILSIDYEKI